MKRAGILCGVALLLAAGLAAETGAERLRKIRDLSFVPEQCYRVRDLALEKEDVKLYFSDGYLLLAQPVEGRVMAALFLAATDGGEGEIILIPPTPAERQSLARFVGAPVLQEQIRTALMFFTDDTADTLRRLLAENPFNKPDPEAGRRLVPDWRPVVRNLVGSYDARMLVDSFSPLGTAPGFFAAALSGVKLGRFDLLLDPRRVEQLSVGQVTYQHERRYYDIWTSFPARSFREGRRQPLADTTLLRDFRIEAAFAANLDMQVVARASLHTGGAGERVIPLELSHQLRISQMLLDGKPVEYLQSEPLDSTDARRRGNDWLLLILEQALEADSRHEIEFHYDGNVVTNVGSDVYIVGERGSWYPNRGFPFTTYDLVLRYPRRLQMVATGRQLESKLDGDFRVTHWKPDAPIRIAGFNLGNYERVTARVGDYTIEVCANKELEPALRPPAIPALPPLPTERRRTPFTPPSLQSTPQAAPVTPMRRIDQVARESADALQFFVERFGPPPLGHLTISPIPANLGQGFPGLVYVSTLSYYQPGDRLLEKFTPRQRLFYSEQLRAHEIAHQWWGNLVGSGGYQNEWLMEALADYSALLYLERHVGPKALEAALTEYKQNLLTKLDSGETLESVGALVLGERLVTSKSPRAHYTITYEKGAWVLHMLRRLMGDPKFFAFLTELRREYEFKLVNTDQFRQLAGRFLPAVPQDPNLEGFFSQWVYNTGIPTLKLEYKMTGRAPQLRLTGAVRQSGVPDTFTVAVPVEIHVPGRAEPVEVRVQTEDGVATFSVPVAQRPTRVVLDPKDSVLAIKQ